MSNMRDTHQQALGQPTCLYHEFLLAYKKRRKCIYGFVEGRTDPSYYANKVRQQLPDEWEVDFWLAGGKKKVIKIFESFDWLRFSRYQILFFVDRDFSPYISDPLPTSKNIYVTDWYSIENSLVNKTLCKRILQDLKGMIYLRGTEMDTVLSLFESELKKFHKKMLPVSAHIIAWLRKGNGPCSDNLVLDKIFYFEDKKLKNKINTAQIPSHLCSVFKLNRRGLMELLRESMLELQGEPNPKRYIRGKYELWFLIEFCNYVHANFNKFSSLIKKKTKTTCNLSLDSAMSILGPRSNSPVSLNDFLLKTVAVFVSTYTK